MDVKLRVLSGKHAGKSIKITKPEFVIGRGEDCQLRVGSDMISRRHSMFSLSEAKFAVQDLGSKNGTLVNGVRIDAPHDLSTGDTVEIGPLKFKIELIGAPAAEPAAAQVEAQAAAKPAAAPARKTSDSSRIDAFIDDWLTEGDAKSSNFAAKETQTLSLQDTEEIAHRVAEGDKDKGKKEPETPAPANRSKFDAPQAKDSREAAANILDKLARRR
jgi:pSer/pThr/pTyr-binding forkhead associated (FHA) protein